MSSSVYASKPTKKFFLEPIHFVPKWEFKTMCIQKQEKKFRSLFIFLGLSIHFNFVFFNFTFFWQENVGDSVGCNEKFFEYLLIWVWFFLSGQAAIFPLIPGVRELKSSRHHKTQNPKKFCQKCWKQVWVQKSSISFPRRFKSRLFERSEPCSLNSVVMNKSTSSFGKTLKVFWWDVVFWFAEG